MSFVDGKLSCCSRLWHATNPAATESLNVFLGRCFMSQSTVICTLQARLVGTICRKGKGAGGTGCPAICSICIKSQEALRINRPLSHGQWVKHANGLIAQFAYLFRTVVCVSSLFLHREYPLVVANPIVPERVSE